MTHWPMTPPSNRGRDISTTEGKWVYFSDWHPESNMIGAPACVIFLLCQLTGECNQISYFPDCLPYPGCSSRLWLHSGPLDQLSRLSLSCNIAFHFLWYLNHRGQKETGGTGEGMTLGVGCSSDCPREGRAERSGVWYQEDLCSNLESAMD